MAEPTFPSLRAEIRHIVESADAFMTSPAIFAQLTRRCTTQVFGVTLTQMVTARQLRKRRVTCAGMGVRYSYGPGPKPVLGKAYRADRPPKVKGLMQIARERAAKARGRAARG